MTIKCWKSLCFLAPPLLLGGGCRAERGGSPPPEAARGLARGDHVVIESAAAEFFEGRVTEADSDRLRVQRLGDGESLSVSAADAYRLPSTTTPAPGLAICKSGDAGWVACRVESIGGARVRAHDVRDRPLELATEHVLTPNAVTELNLRHAFARSRRHADFERAVTRAGRPRPPAGWRPGPRERVLASDGTGWYSARIRELEDERVHVVWKADERVTELPRGEVVPEPPYRRTPARGQIVLVRPRVAAGPWAPVRVVATSGSIVVEDADGSRRTVAARDVVPLGGD